MPSPPGTRPLCASAPPPPPPGDAEPIRAARHGRRRDGLVSPHGQSDAVVAPTLAIEGSRGEAQHLRPLRETVTLQPEAAHVDIFSPSDHPLGTRSAARVGRARPPRSSSAPPACCCACSRTTRIWSASRTCWSTRCSAHARPRGAHHRTPCTAMHRQPMTPTRHLENACCAHHAPPCTARAHTMHAQGAPHTMHRQPMTPTRQLENACCAHHAPPCTARAHTMHARGAHHRTPCTASPRSQRDTSRTRLAALACVCGPSRCPGARADGGGRLSAAHAAPAARRAAPAPAARAGAARVPDERHDGGRAPLQLLRPLPARALPRPRLPRHHAAPGGRAGVDAARGADGRRSMVKAAVLARP